MIKNIISRFTMVKTGRVGFCDKVSGEMVHHWQDYYFQKYMASSKWGFRVKY
jgi:hypothetical protein